MKLFRILALTLISIVTHAGANPTSSITLEDGTKVLTDDQQMTLYTFDVDSPNQSNCHGSCLTIWPPMIVEDPTSVAAPFGVIERDNGELQLTLNQMPLYFYIADKKAGDILGDNVGGVWHIIELTE